jgi:hypothetical protein
MSVYHETWIFLTDFLKVLSWAFSEKSVQWDPRRYTRTERRTERWTNGRTDRHDEALRKCVKSLKIECSQQCSCSLRNEHRCQTATVNYILPHYSYRYCVTANSLLWSVDMDVCSNNFIIRDLHYITFPSCLHTLKPMRKAVFSMLTLGATFILGTFHQLLNSMKHCFLTAQNVDIENKGHIHQQNKKL